MRVPSGGTGRAGPSVPLMLTAEHIKAVNARRRSPAVTAAAVDTDIRALLAKRKLAARVANPPARRGPRVLVAGYRPGGSVSLHLQDPSWAIHAVVAEHGLTPEIRRIGQRRLAAARGGEIKTCRHGCCTIEYR